MEALANCAVLNTTDSLKLSITNHLRFTLGAYIETASENDWYVATSLAVRDRVMEKATQSRRQHRSQGVRRVHYLSLEYLMGRLLENNLRNAGIYDATKEALSEMGKDLDALVQKEPDMGLGNGGLGRLAACFMDSLSTMDLPAIGYGIHYEFGLFRQEFVNGKQVEHPDAWMRDGSPWKIARPSYRQAVKLYGQVIQKFDEFGRPHFEWIDTKCLLGLPWDIPIVGYDSNTVNVLRLWQAQADEDFNFKVFNEGSYIEALREKAIAETVSKVLYPNDATESGKELRLVQQYFFVACSLADIVRRFKGGYDLPWSEFPAKAAVQLNDTHPAVAIPELMRILVDDEKLEWSQAWDICQKTFSYTNHTLLPEALETWSAALFERVLPRHLQIIYEINQRFMDVVEARWPGDGEKKRVLSLIEESGGKKVRMAHMSVLGSHATNGVAALHTRLLCERLFPEFFELYPERFLNLTNGVTFRRWLDVCNPELSSLITESIGAGWLKDSTKLIALDKFADDASFKEKFQSIKRGHKVRLAKIIQDTCGVSVSPDALFDVQIKRLHEYKRQHLNLLHIVTLYRKIIADPNFDMAPRVFIFGAKAAPGYYLAKNIIHAINALAAKVNHDPRVNGKLKVIYIPNYGVSIAERIIPAADLSEQISTAGKEASGTGNMKLALNGALTIGTLDGANVEILEEVGPDNIFIFGLTAEQAEARRAQGIDARATIAASLPLKRALDAIGSGLFSPGEPDRFREIVDVLTYHDHFLVSADFVSYAAAQRRVDEHWRDPAAWWRSAIFNIAGQGYFSSDRAIREYCADIWNVKLPGGG